MAALQGLGFFLQSHCGSRLLVEKNSNSVVLSLPKSRTKCNSIPLPRNLQIGGLANELDLRSGFSSLISPKEKSSFNLFRETESDDDSLVVAKLYAILEAVADRVEMHNNIGKQREDWNSLLLTSINAITLTASIISGIAATNGAVGAPLAALKVASTLMFLGATGLLLVMNKIQPSQLVEEQRNAARLFQQLHNQIKTILTVGKPTDKNVNEAMNKVLALDRAYPLPLLGTMLEKFPSKVEPAVWWPRSQQTEANDKEDGHGTESNGWNPNLEKEMRSIIDVLRRKDEADYLRLGEKALKLNKLWAVTGPSLTAIAAIGSAFVGTTHSWAAILAVVGGALASVVNTFEHGGQVGMVFEMYRNNAGFFMLMEESIESNLMDRKENGEVFEMKVALQLGRSLSELRTLASSSFSSVKEEGADEFGSKLF